MDRITFGPPSYAHIVVWFLAGSETDARVRHTDGSYEITTRRQHEWRGSGQSGSSHHNPINTGTYRD